mmetsp:Transcript_27829/g.77978  ORF Transcript_27829/g.77978 Transcript_27829/m.77978 type:complete len:202 (-) Transcript_27829:2247-2852(-)
MWLYRNSLQPLMRTPTSTSPFRFGSSANVMISTTRCICFRMPSLDPSSPTDVSPVNWFLSNVLTFPLMEISYRNSSQYGSCFRFPSILPDSASPRNCRLSFSLLMDFHSIVLGFSSRKCHVSALRRMYPFSTLGMFHSSHPLTLSVKMPERASLCAFKRQSFLASLLQKESNVPSQIPDGWVNMCPLPGFCFGLSNPATLL